MLIRIPNNVHFGQLQVLAVNLNAFERVVIRKSGDNFQLTLDSTLQIEPHKPITDKPATQHVIIQNYQTQEQVLQAFDSMMKAYQNREQVWTP